MTLKGSHCTRLELMNMSVEMGKAPSIMASLPLAENIIIKVFGLSYHATLMSSMQPGNSTMGIPCRLCGEDIDKKLRRKHKCTHIVKDDLKMLCGFGDSYSF